MATDIAALWWMTLGIAVVVIVVVAALLIAIIVATRRIDEHVAAVWSAGKDIASNTVQIWQLQKTNAVASQILAVAEKIAAGAASIDERLARLAAALGASGSTRSAGGERRP